MIPFLGRSSNLIGRGGRREMITINDFYGHKHSQKHKEVVMIGLKMIGFKSVIAVLLLLAMDIGYSQTIGNFPQIDVLKSGVENWNRWRGANTSVKPRLDSANLRRANLRRVNLRGADLRGARLEKARLDCADLRGANLEGAYLDSANLREANLAGADLAGARLKGANLWNANLENANFEGAYLKGADLQEANIDGANFKGTHLD